MSANNLQEKYPNVATEWDYKLNYPLTPKDVKPHSNRTVHWICAKGHRWKAQINNRTTNYTRCPYCTGTLPIPGETDLETLFPRIAKEWHPTKNAPLTPRDVTIKSNRMVVWICEHGHEWESKIYHRTDGTGCPYCAGQRAIRGENDLVTLKPLVAADWDYERNGDDKPFQFTAYSHKKVHWIGPCGHSWAARIFDRSKGQGCPICSGRIVIPGINDLQTLRPDLAAQWDYEYKGDLKPTAVTVHSNKIVGWKCEKGHRWRSSINNRTYGRGCPYCNQHRLIPGVNSLDVIKPDLVAQWHPTKNGSLTPRDVTAFDNEKRWWLCEKGHDWDATVSNRSNGKNCPYCSGRKVIKDETDLATRFPVIALDWHPEKNKGVLPSDISPFANVKYWWRCKKGHDWEAPPSSRCNGSGCPYCAKRKMIPGETDFATVAPLLVPEWHPEKNGKVKPCDVAASSPKKYWWVCKNGHDWEASPASRSNGSGCPTCKGRKKMNAKHL